MHSTVLVSLQGIIGYIRLMDTDAPVIVIAYYWANELLQVPAIPSANLILSMNES